MPRGEISRPIIVLPSTASKRFMAVKRTSRPLSLAALTLIRGYQLVMRPFLAGSGGCRFVPSCSEYAAQSVEAHGAIRGSWLALKRVLRCRPFGGHGLDPVP
jgi:putative membrane protein insertion efficiency factor